MCIRSNYIKTSQSIPYTYHAANENLEQEFNPLKLNHFQVEINLRWSEGNKVIQNT